MHDIGRGYGHAEDDFAFGLRAGRLQSQQHAGCHDEKTERSFHKAPFLGFTQSRSKELRHGAMRPSTHLASDIKPTPNSITTTMGTKSLSVSRALA